MDIIYKKDTLYVYLDDEISEDMIYTVEDKINTIMGTYKISNLVIKPGNLDTKLFEPFRKRYNQNHKTNMIIK